MIITLTKADGENASIYASRHNADQAADLIRAVIAGDTTRGAAGWPGVDVPNIVRIEVDLS